MLGYTILCYTITKCRVGKSSVQALGGGGGGLNAYGLNRDCVKVVTGN